MRYSRYAYPISDRTQRNKPITCTLSPQERNLRCVTLSRARARAFRDAFRGRGNSAQAPRRRGSTAKRDTSGSDTSVSPCAGKREERRGRIARPRVLSGDVAAGVSRCASRPDEFTHGLGGLSVRPSGFLDSLAARLAQFALHLLQIGLPSFLARTYAYASERVRGYGAAPPLPAARTSLSRAKRRADNPLRRMRRIAERSFAIGHVYSYVAGLNKIDACWHALATTTSSSGSTKDAVAKCGPLQL